MTLSEHIAAALKPGQAGVAARLTFMTALRADRALVAAANAHLAEIQQVVDARGEQACMMTARDAKLLRGVLQDARV